MRRSDVGIRAGIRRFFRLALRRPDLARADVDDEISFHLDARVEQLVSAGMGPDEARREALERFGDVAAARSELSLSAARQAAQQTLQDKLGILRDDVRYIVRTLARSRAFAVTVIVTFALGIGASAAMFGIVDRLLLRGPAYVLAPQRVQRLYITMEEGHGSETGPVFGYVTYAFLRDQARSFERVAAYSGVGDATFGVGRLAERIQKAHVTWDFFATLGVRPALGRFFTPDEDRPPDGQRVLVLEQGFWERSYGADSSVLGRTATLDGESYVIVGVAPRGFTGVELRRVDAWAPMSLIHTTPNWASAWNAEWLAIVARLKPGVSTGAASAEATLLYRRNYTGKNQANAAATLAFHPTSFSDAAKESPESAVSRWLTGVAAIVLLIACANVTNLLLARATRRKREIAVRLALGISRWRLIRLLVAESVLLALAGCVGGVLLAYWGGALIRKLLLPNVAFTSSPVDARVLMVALALAVTTGLLVGFIPAFQARGLELTSSLKAGSQQSGSHRTRMRTALLFAQAALSVILLIGAGLFVRSLLRVEALDLGYQPDRVLRSGIQWPSFHAAAPEESGRERARRIAVYQEVVTRLRARPDVQHAAVAVGTPFGNSFGVDLWVPGHDTIPDLGGGGPFIQAVTAGYFETVGLRLMQGRTFTGADRAGSERVAIVNEPMARALWPGESPLEKCLQVFNRNIPCARVVGVVNEARRFALREPHAMQYYVPFGQEIGIGGSVILVRPTGRLELFIPVLRRVVQEVEPNALYVGARSMQSSIDPLVRPWRMGAALFAIFGGLALIIAAIGLYSVVAYMVAQRTQEFGVRLALGATRLRIMAMVLSRGVTVSIAGLVAGSAAALLAGRFLEPLLFETSARDPLVFGLVVAVLLCVAVLACLLPARRATRVDPAVALRAD